jgi:BirA family transcriptional regulator, biotin operon repressor / biotin---[acetyl-CoA-carboxylase] ligase
MTGFGHPRRHFRVTDSTNERARELALAGAPGGTVVTAEEQTSGRGRRGRAWAAPAGEALLYSAILRPLGRGQVLLPLAVPLAVCEAVETLASLECRVKWPNDVWVCDPPASPSQDARDGDSGDGDTAGPRGRKVAGVLLEARPPEWAVIGIGLNVAIEPDEFPGELRWPATSVGHGVTTAAVLAAVNESLARWVNADPAEVVAAFGARDALLGQEVRWEGAGGEDGSSGAGRAEGIDDDGNLVVAVAGGRRMALGAGEVQLVLEAPG